MIFKESLNKKAYQFVFKVKKGLISVIIPGYNEEKVIANSISVVEKELYSFHRPFELLIVDDGSKDSTLEIVKELIESGHHSNLRVVSYKDGPSRRENLSKSFRLLRGEYIILCDMDLSMDPKHLKEMIYWLEKGFDMVIPGRYHKYSRIKRDTKRYIISKMYNTFIRALFRTDFKDNICGFKAFKRNVAMRLVKEAGMDNTRTRSVFWDTQLIIYAKYGGMKIKEIPIHWKEGKNSALTFKREIKMLPYIIKFWWNFHKK